MRQKTLCTDSFPDDGDMLLSEVAGTDPPDLSPSRPLGETETAFFHSIFQIFEGLKVPPFQNIKCQNETRLSNVFDV